MSLRKRKNPNNNYYVDNYVIKQNIEEMKLDEEMQDIRLKFSNRLNELLEKNELYQKDFAKQIGIAEGTLTNYKDGTRIPKVDVMVKMAKVLNVSVDYLSGASDIKTNFENNEISEKLGLTSEAIEILEILHQNGDYMISTINFLIEQEVLSPEYFGFSFIAPPNITDDERDKLYDIAQQKLDQKTEKWKAKRYIQLINEIDNYFNTQVQNGEIYITEKQMTLKNKGQKDRPIFTKKILTNNEVVDNVYLQKINELLKELKKKYLIDREKRIR